MERQKEQEEEYAREKEAKKEGMRKRKEKFAAQEKTDEELEGFAKLRKLKKLESIKAASSKNQLASGLWTDDDLVELVRLVKKYPGGTPARWEVIAEMMNRTVTEITFMAAKMKENGYRVPGQTDSVAETIVQETQKMVQRQYTKYSRWETFKILFLPQINSKAASAAEPKDDEPIVMPETDWSQRQQQLLELAIIKYPKTCGADRWAKIASEVPDKTADQCVARYKHLVEVVKAQRKSRAADESKTQAIGHGDAVAADGQTDELEKGLQPMQGGGKPRNKRKDRKNKMQFSSDEDEE